MARIFISTALVALVATAHEHSQKLFSGPHDGLWFNALPGDGGTQVRDVGSSLETATHPPRPTLSSPVSLPSDAFPTSLASAIAKLNMTLLSSVLGYAFGCYLPANTHTYVRL